jgi:hypothetical protein
MSLHIHYDHRCVNCGAVYIPYDRDVPCPQCEGVATGRVRIDELGRIICNARLQGLLDCLRQGLAAEVEPESYMDVLAHPLWRGLPQLAACFVVCVCGTALIRDLQVSSPHAVRKVSMTGSVLQAMCDDMDSALS